MERARKAKLAAKARARRSEERARRAALQAALLDAADLFVAASQAAEQRGR